MTCSAHAELAIELRNLPWTRGEIFALTKCPACNASRQPEPSEDDRALLFQNPDLTWVVPDGVYLWSGYGFAGGGGLGSYVNCDGCGFFAKEPPNTERE